MGHTASRMVSERAHESIVCVVDHDLDPVDRAGEGSEEEVVSEEFGFSDEVEVEGGEGGAGGEEWAEPRDWAEDGEGLEGVGDKGERGEEGVIVRVVVSVGVIEG